MVTDRRNYTPKGVLTTNRFITRTSKNTVVSQTENVNKKLVNK